MEVSKEEPLFIPKETNFLDCKDAEGETLINHRQNPPFDCVGGCAIVVLTSITQRYGFDLLNCYSKWKNSFLFSTQNIILSDYSHRIRSPELNVLI